MDKCGNLLTATALAICDAQALAMAERFDLNPSITATIFTLGQHDAQSLSQLAVVTGITHSAMVRLIDGLERKGFIIRGTGGRDRREVPISLTEVGQALYTTLRQVQAQVMAPLVASLTAQHREVLEAALAHILTTLTTGRDSADHICRFCDEEVCGQDHCPVARQVQRLAQA